MASRPPSMITTSRSQTSVRCAALSHSLGVLSSARGRPTSVTQAGCAFPCCLTIQEGALQTWQSEGLLGCKHAASLQASGEPETGGGCRARPRSAGFPGGPQPFCLLGDLPGPQGSGLSGRKRRRMRTEGVPGRRGKRERGPRHAPRGVSVPGALCGLARAQG